jgi:hypothetical protein
MTCQVVHQLHHVAHQVHHVANVIHYLGTEQRPGPAIESPELEQPLDRESIEAWRPSARTGCGSSKRSTSGRCRRVVAAEVLRRDPGPAAKVFPAPAVAPRMLPHDAAKPRSARGNRGIRTGSRSQHQTSRDPGSVMSRGRAGMVPSAARPPAGVALRRACPAGARAIARCLRTRRRTSDGPEGQPAIENDSWGLPGGNESKGATRE